MKIVLSSAILLILFYGNVLAHNSSEAKSETENADDQPPSSLQSEASIKSSYSGRIINGMNADIATFPYMLRLRVSSVGKCGASVITYWHAFTAGHCVYNVNSLITITLYGGSTSQNTGGVLFRVANISIHPQYNDSTLDYDAAIIKVKTSFQGYKNIAPVPLQDVEVPVLTSCYVIGWGWTKYETKATPDNLQYAQLQIVDQRTCDASYIYVPQETICAYRGNGTDICLGDSGGPFVCNGKLTGATSFVGPGCKSQIPAGFVKVMAPTIRQFIRNVTGI